MIRPATTMFFCTEPNKRFLQGGAPLVRYNLGNKNPMKTSSIYHPQKPVRDIGVMWTPTERDFVAGGTTLCILHSLSGLGCDVARVITLQ